MKLKLLTLFVMLFFNCQQSTNIVSQDIECQLKLEVYNRLIYCEQLQARTITGLYRLRPLLDSYQFNSNELEYKGNMEVNSLLSLDIVIKEKIIRQDTMFIHFAYYHNGYCVSPEFPDIYTKAVFVKNKLKFLFQGSIYGHVNNMNYGVLKEYVNSKSLHVNAWLRKNINCQ